MAGAEAASSGLGPWRGPSPAAECCVNVRLSETRWHGSQGMNRRKATEARRQAPLRENRGLVFALVRAVEAEDETGKQKRRKDQQKQRLCRKGELASCPAEVLALVLDSCGRVFSRGSKRDAIDVHGSIWIKPGAKPTFRWASKKCDRSRPWQPETPLLRTTEHTQVFLCVSSMFLDTTSLPRWRLEIGHLARWRLAQKNQAV